MKFRPAVIGLLLLAATASLPTARAYPGCDPTNASTWSGSVSATETLPGFAGVTGIYARPANPTSLVAFFHGYGNDSRSWACHVLDAASHGALAFSLDYRGTTGPFRNTRGWFVKEGAEDSNRLANYFLGRPENAGIGPVVSFGISMGGNASGLAVARHATRPGGAPLYDHLIDVEGVNNLAEEYAIATAVSPAVPTGKNAVEDINAECAANYSDAVSCLADLTVVAHAKDIADGGLKGAVVVHGVDDGLVPTDMSRQLSTTLRALGIPVEQYTALRRNVCPAGDRACIDSEGGTTFTENAGNPIFDGASLGKYPEPLAGHGWEGSDTHLVIKTGLDRLWALLTSPSVLNAECAVDGEAGAVCVPVS